MARQFGELARQHGAVILVERDLHRLCPGIAEYSDPYSISRLLEAPFRVVKPVAVNVHILFRFIGDQSIRAWAKSPAYLLVRRVKLWFKLHTCDTQDNFRQNRQKKNR